MGSNISNNNFIKNDIIMILTNPVFLSGLVLVLLIMIVVIIYNVYQENYHRQQMRQQFGFVQEDALLGQQVVSVRDGQVRNQEQETEKPTLLRTSKVAQVEAEKEEKINDSVLPEPSEPVPVSEIKSSEAEEAISEPTSEEIQKFSVQEVESVSSEPHYFVFEKDENADEESEQDTFFTDDSLIENVQLTKEIEEITQSITDDSDAAETTYLVDPETFKQHEFANFDRRFDYLMYIGLSQWQEISAIPIFSQTRFYQVLGQTENGVFELVEPIPDKRYRAFVLGIQGVSREGLITAEELAYFQQQVTQFAQKMKGKVASDDERNYLQRARAVDEWCEKRDFLVDLYLIPAQEGRKLSGAILRQKLQAMGFVWRNDGMFAYQKNGSLLCTLSLFDHQPFGEHSFYQQHEGVLVSFDPANVPNGEHSFGEMMVLLNILLDDLSLELVDDQRIPLTTEWLMEVQSYIGNLQQQMKEQHLEVGGYSAIRLFS